MSEILVLRVLHIVVGGFWFGAAVFAATFLIPAIRDAGPAGGPVMGALVRRGMMVTLPAVAIVTILSGFALVWRFSGGDMGAYAGSPAGRIYTMSGGLAVIAFLVGFFVSRPTGTAMGRLVSRLSTLPDGPEKGALVAELGSLQLRSLRAGQVIAVLVIVATTGMAVARYAG